MKNMKTRGLNILVLLVIILIFAGCKKAAPLILKEIGPTKTKAGQAFNVQPGGGAAMWLKTENATKTTVVVWGETKLRTTFVNSQELTAAVAPEDLYSKPGKCQIYLLDTKTGAKSNSLVFTVEE
jgi:hypothetical protein